MDHPVLSLHRGDVRSRNGDGTHGGDDMVHGDGGDGDEDKGHDDGGDEDKDMGHDGDHGRSLVLAIQLQAGRGAVLQALT